MKEVLKVPKSHSVYIMIDGCSKKNPGKGGAGVAFLSKLSNLDEPLYDQGKI
jgi:ribonuclease HI